MEYTKVVAYADILEIYEYEKRPTSTRGNRKPNAPGANGTGVSDDRQVDAGHFQQEKIREERSVKRAVVAFRRLVRANLRFAENPILVTLTYQENMADWETGRKDFNTFARNIKYTFGESVRYICVSEYQKRGAIHYHALFWGVPPCVVRAERDTRLVASLWGQGFVFLKETDGHAKLSSYLVKYFSKSMRDNRLFGKKLYIASRNVLRPVVDKNAMLMPYLHLSTYKTLHKSEYMTLYMGIGRYRRLQEIPKPTYENHTHLQAGDSV